MNKIDFGKKISTLRKEKGLTQKELANKLCVSDKTVSKWETGINYPDITLLENLSDILGCEISSFFENSENEEIINECIKISNDNSNAMKKEFKIRYWFCLIISVLGFVTSIVLVNELGKIETLINIRNFGFISVILINCFALICSSCIFWLRNNKKT